MVNRSTMGEFCPLLDPNGNWVSYADYAALIAERDALATENASLRADFGTALEQMSKVQDALATERDSAQKERDALAAQIEMMKEMREPSEQKVLNEQVTAWAREIERLADMIAFAQQPGESRPIAQKGDLNE